MWILIGESGDAAVFWPGFRGVCGLREDYFTVWHSLHHHRLRRWRVLLAVFGLQFLSGPLLPPGRTVLP